MSNETLSYVLAAAFLVLLAALVPVMDMLRRIVNSFNSRRESPRRDSPRARRTPTPANSP